ncbi:hypothetical protein M5C90_15100 [Pseudomonas chlororaphis subsp. piscium]|nr:hypothetical protein M5C90_15100 [Pseudomonas chlororaphis subsp. piscium]
MNKIAGMLKSKAPMTVVGVVILGIVCSAIYDAVVKPGFNVVSKVIFDLITFGSQRVKDYAFSNAALDPTSLPVMFIFLNVVGVSVAFVLVANFIVRIKKKAIRRLVSKDEMTTDADGGRVGVDHERLTLIEKKLEKIKYVSWVIDGFFVALLFVMVTVVNQSILVWRVHNANERIVAPYISNVELLKIQSKFSQIKTEKDYEDVYGMIKAVADKNNIELRDEGTW